ncbi:alkaline phosphatase family protein [Aquisphaera insulae]|uniref:alkaline phosphatase family protein n=1 Tax=Aquisphaera insulae TaxID=2712864 RepID=UPI0013EBB3FF|nr:nucleotide pyrophosphatase/phosphodiesterase family protein [Aquisphaera insulae]
MHLPMVLVAMLAMGVAQATAAPDRHVVVITLDGFPSYLLDDPNASLPTLRGLRDAGAYAVDGMQISNPAVTWPNHTTLMTGVHPDRHGVLFNGILERHGVGKPVRVLFQGKEQRDFVRIPLLFDHLKAAGVESAAINWPCTRGSTSIEANFPDVPEPLAHTSTGVKLFLDRAGHVARFAGGNNVVRDEIWTETACQVIRERKPGFLALHLLNVDSTHHKYGPKTLPGYTATALADAQVGRVLMALGEAGIRERTSVLVVADHGFVTVRKTLRPNAILRREGLLVVKGAEVTSARVQVVPEGGTGMVYLTNPETAEIDRQSVRRLFQGAEGIEAILGPEEYPRYHLPAPRDDPQMSDLVLVARDGYAFTASSAGEALVVPVDQPYGAHGYISTDPAMNALFIASGSGIRPGTKIRRVENVDVAPTAAKLLGVKLDGTLGRVLGEILEGPG